MSSHAHPLQKPPLRPTTQKADSVAFTEIHLNFNKCFAKYSRLLFHRGG